MISSEEEFHAEVEESLVPMPPPMTSQEYMKEMGDLETRKQKAIELLRFKLKEIIVELATFGVMIDETLLFPKQETPAEETVRSKRGFACESCGKVFAKEWGLTVHHAKSTKCKGAKKYAR